MEITIFNGDFHYKSPCSIAKSRISQPCPAMDPAPPEVTGGVGPGKALELAAGVGPPDPSCEDQGRGHPRMVGHYIDLFDVFFLMDLCGIYVDVFIWIYNDLYGCIWNYMDLHGCT